MPRLNLIYLFVLCTLISPWVTALYSDGLPNDVQLTATLAQIEKYIVDNEVGVKLEMMRAHSEVSLILTELQKSCFNLKTTPHQFLDSVCRGIGNIMYESMNRQNYFIQNSQNLKIFILPLDTPILPLRKTMTDVASQQRYLFFNLIDWVSLNRMQKRIYVLLELMNFKGGDSDADRFSAASSIYYGLQTADTEMTLQANGEQLAGYEMFYFQQDDKILFSSTNSNENKSTVYVSNKNMVGFQPQSCSAYKDYPKNLWRGFDYKLSSTDLCRNTSSQDNTPMMLYPKQNADSLFSPMTFSERLKILLRCGS